MTLTENLDKSIKDIEVKFEGGLSNTSTKKFNDLSVVVSSITGLPEDDIYITSVYARPSNTWNRLSQGKPLSRHYTLGVCIASPDGVNGVLAPLGSFIGAGKVHYDSIAVIAQDGDGCWKIKAIATNAKDMVSVKCQDQYAEAVIKLVNVVENPLQEVVSRAVNPEDAKSNPSSNIPNLGNAPRQLIVYGAPGTGKSWRIKRDTEGCDVIRTTFHPDSDYSTFVGAYKPSMEDVPRTFMKGEEIAKVTKGDECLFREKRIVYKFVAQAFLKAYVRAWRKLADATDGAPGTSRPTGADGAPGTSRPTGADGAPGTSRPTVYLVIEEINRGNCAQIFGDLFQLLDRNDEGFSEYEIAADDDLRRYLKEAFAGVADAINCVPPADATERVPPSADAMNRVPPEIAEKLERVFKGEILLLPENLSIWATMNTSDQSLFPIDSAFKRRWEWKHMPIHDAQKGYRIAVGADLYDWWDFLDKANALVQDFTDSEDKKLGYFFCRANPDGTIPLERFVGKVVFYLWNDVFKDDGFDRDVFDDGKGGKLLFKSFFNPDGSPRAEAVRQFFANLGVAKAASDGIVAEGASSVGEEPPKEGASA